MDMPVVNLSKSLFLGEKIVTFPASSISFSIPTVLLSSLNFVKALPPALKVIIEKFHGEGSIMNGARHN